LSSNGGGWLVNSNNGRGRRGLVWSPRGFGMARGDGKGGSRGFISALVCGADVGGGWGLEGAQAGKKKFDLKTMTVLKDLGQYNGTTLRIMVDSFICDITHV